MKSHKILSSVFLASTLIGALCITGCDAGKPKNTAPVADPPPVVVEEKPAPPAQEPERVLVNIGDNVTGKVVSHGGGEQAMDIVLVPIATYFTIKERTVFNIQIPQAINLYKASNDNKMPATHEDYMRDIIEYNKINLPPLRNPKDKYQYDPESGELKISTVK